MIQFYESYSRAGYQVFRGGQTREDYLRGYVQNIWNAGESWTVNFEEEPGAGLRTQSVSLPLDKLVWGFANGWADNPDEKSLFFPIECVQAAYQGLWDWMMTPRGVMFWIIDQEGTNGVFYAKDMNEVLHTRSAARTSQT